MKRGAEKQLSKDGEYDEENADNDDPGRGFTKADEKTLGARKIRGLPKRATQSGTAGLASTPTAFGGFGVSKDTPPPSVPTASRFGGFGGFGATTSTTTPFSFGATSSTTPSGFGSSTSTNAPTAFTEPANSTPSLFGAKSPFATTGSTGATPSLFGASTAAKPPPTTAVSTNASSAVKSFASFLDKAPASAITPTTTSIPALAPSPKENGTTASNNTSSENSAELTYYKSLRGLNVSLLNAISSAVEKDPFADIATLLEQYKSFRLSVQRDFDDTKSLKPSTAATKVDAPKPAAPPLMPAPPTSFAGFKPLVPSSSGSTSTGSTGGFTPKLENGSKSSSSGFSFPVSTPSVAAVKEEPKLLFASNSSAPSSGFTFGTKTSSDAPESNEHKSEAPKLDGIKPTTSGFTFGTPTATSSPPKSLFGGSDPTPSLFGSKPSPFTFGDKTITKDDAPKPTSLFGSPLGTPGGSSGFSFGSGSGSPSGASTPGDKGATNPFSFTRTAGGSLGNPVGFGFGVRTTDGDGAPKSSTPFTFGASSTATSSAGTTPAPVEEADAKPTEDTAGEGENPAKLTLNTANDEEGAGEEDEETTHEVRSKVYRLLKNKEGGNYWADTGVGMLRLKRHRGSDTRRILLRNSSTGKILINFNLYVGLDPTVTDKVVAFVGQDETGASAPYKIRLKTAEQAEELKGALEREIEFVRSKGGD